MKLYKIVNILYLGLITISAFSIENCPQILSASYVQMLQIEKEIQSNKLEKINTKVFARILRGATEDDFRFLSNDKGRKIVMLMDHEGILDIWGNKNSMPPLEKIGYTREYIRELIDNKTMFKLLLVSNTEEIRQATWDNLGIYLKQVYGETHLAYKLHRRYMRKLKKFTFNELMNEMGFKEVLPIDSQRLTSQSSLWEYRSFLYNELRLTELYTGTGYTMTNDGKNGVAEYFILNQPIKYDNLGYFKLVNLNI